MASRRSLFNGSGHGIARFFSMMRYGFVLFSLLSYAGASAQNMKNFYRQTQHAEGTLYFVLPREMPCDETKSIEAAGPMSYDYTYLDARDSVAMLMTVATDRSFVPDSVRIETHLTEFRCAVEPIYCVAVRRGWQSRFRCVVPYGFWEEMYTGDDPFVLCVFSVGGEVRLGFSDKKREREKIRPYFERLQETIRLNR